MAQSHNAFTLNNYLLRKNTFSYFILHKYLVMQEQIVSILKEII